jgi:hypothetical protein
MKRILLLSAVALLASAAPASAGGVAAPDRLFAITRPAPHHIVSFDSSAPSAAYLTDKVITGVGAEVILGIDSRPRNGALYIVTDAEKLYTVNPATGGAALVAPLAADPADASSPWAGTTSTRSTIACA